MIRHLDETVENVTKPGMNNGRRIGRVERVNLCILIHLNMLGIYRMHSYIPQVKLNWYQR